MERTRPLGRYYCWLTPESGTSRGSRVGEFNPLGSELCVKTIQTLGLNVFVDSGPQRLLHERSAEEVNRTLQGMTGMRSLLHVLNGVIGLGVPENGDRGNQHL